MYCQKNNLLNFLCGNDNIFENVEVMIEYSRYVNFLIFKNILNWQFMANLMSLIFLKFTEFYHGGNQ